MKYIKIKSGLVYLISLGMIAWSCSDLEEEVLDGVHNKDAETEYAVSSENPDDLLSGAYTSGAIREAYMDQGRLFALDELSTDAALGPTRGGDWDDNAVLRQLHTHTYGPDHDFNKNTWIQLYAAIHEANLVIGSSPNAQQEAEARFLRALSYYHVIDLWGQVPYREIGSDPNADALVYSRAEATNWVISDLEDTMADLPASNPLRANQNAAHWLLAKLYLNKAVFTADAPEGPYNFDNADMDQVIAHIDAISGTVLADDYWDNFIPTNTETSEELIFVLQNFGGISSGPVRSRWHMGQHYNQTPGGWNGFTTLSEYYDMFDPNDERINKWVEEVTEKSGYNVGFQIGQQYGPGGPGVGDPLDDRLGNPLIFTKEVELVNSGSAIEVAGIRGVKYVPDYGGSADGDNAGRDNADNDFVIARYADALLMKAEALARKGDTGGAQTLVQQLANEASTTISSVDDILDVRARELWWEGWRRNDRVRFGVYLSSMELKEYDSDPKYILYPIPAGALLNPNLVQNPGY